MYKLRSVPWYSITFLLLSFRLVHFLRFKSYARLISKVAGPHLFRLDPDLPFYVRADPARLFTWMRIMIRIRLLVKVMSICDHCFPPDPPRFQFEFPRLHCEHPWHSMAFFASLKLRNQNADPDLGFHSNLDRDPASQNNAVPQPYALVSALKVFISVCFNYQFLQDWANAFLKVWSWINKYHCFRCTVPVLLICDLKTHCLSTAIGYRLGLPLSFIFSSCTAVWLEPSPSMHSLAASSPVWRPSFWGSAFASRLVISSNFCQQRSGRVGYGRYHNSAHLYLRPCFCSLVW